MQTRNFTWEDASIRSGCRQTCRTIFKSVISGGGSIVGCFTPGLGEQVKPWPTISVWCTYVCVRAHTHTCTESLSFLCFQNWHNITNIVALLLFLHRIPHATHGSSPTDHCFQSWSQTLRWFPFSCRTCCRAWSTRYGVGWGRRLQCTIKSCKLRLGQESQITDPQCL